MKDLDIWEEDKDKVKQKDRDVSSRDRLTYKLILQSGVNECIKAMGTDKFKPKVQGLKAAMYINVPGLPWKTLIDEEEGKLKESLNKTVEELKQDCYTWYGITGIPIREDLDYRYHQYLFRILLDVLSKYGATIQAKDFIEHGEPES
jgi:hypothetical protein